ncbi:MAG: septation protein SpoVG family protein [Candidatus Omnitrophica bacterium]|nr:septation protein SpoVG family protein [Candidatus Omnitrophota bacterium]
MKITEVRIFPKEGADKKLRAFATITFDDCFVVRDIKVIEGNKGYFVAMPSRRVKEPCLKCGHRNVIRSRFCNQCGSSQPQLVNTAEQMMDPSTLSQAEHKDVAHPITAECRDYIQRLVLEAYQREKDKLQTSHFQGQAQGQ